MEVRAVVAVAVVMVGILGVAEEAAAVDVAAVEIDLELAVVRRGQSACR